MRLIDADILEKEIYKWMPKDQEAWMDSGLPPIENLVVSIMMTIQEQPTVDAVPVDEWLLNHYEVSNEYQNKVIDELVSLYRAERKEE